MATRWSEPRWLSDGQDVWLPVEYFSETGKMRVIKCVVACAAGNHARIRCPPFGEEKWHRLSELRVPPDDPRHWEYQAPKEAI